MTLNSLAAVHRRLGNLSRARELVEHALRIREEAFGPNHPQVAVTLSNLLEIMKKLGEYDEALILGERIIRSHEETFGPNHPNVAFSLASVGEIHRLKGNHKQAYLQFERALRIQEKAFGPVHPSLAGPLDSLAEVQIELGNRSKAVELFQRSLRIREETLGPTHPLVANTLTSLGWLFAQNREYEKVEPLFERALEIRENAFGPLHPDVALSVSDMARLKQAQQEFATALRLYERAGQIYLAAGRQNVGLGDEELETVLNRGLHALKAYSLLLAAIASDHRFESMKGSVISNGFKVAEQMRGWTVQIAVARSVARSRVGTPARVKLMEERNELSGRRQALWNQLNRIYGMPIENRNQPKMDQLKNDLQLVQKDLDKQTRKIETMFPRYAEMVIPEPADAQKVKSMLNTDEVLLTYYTLSDRVQIWVLKAEKELKYYEVPIKKAKLVSLVNRLRNSLMPAWDFSTNTFILPPFDVDSAFQLYDLLIQPLETDLVGGQDLILVPDDVLLPLPFAALISERGGKEFNHLSELYNQGRSPPRELLLDYTTLPWLANAFPLTILPSASALKLFRQTGKVSGDNAVAFIGFGDPVLQGTGQERGGTMVASRGVKVSRADIQALNRLPGTRAELLALAAALSVDPEKHLYLGDRAIEPEVKRLNKNGRLGKAKVLAFATHGLLAGELRGLTQPALVLTPPAVPTEEDDGLLAMEEVLQLQLSSTDWVILSACNTAGGDGSGQGLSGLARAFFYAGAKSLLVSHWSVDDRATQALMTEIFEGYARDPKMSPAQALQKGMLALIDQAIKSEHSYFAHPFAWAPFFLVGEGSMRSF